MFCSDQAYVHKSVMEELKRIIDDSEITKEDDALWPPPDRVGRQVCLWVQLGGVGVFREPPTPPSYLNRNWKSSLETSTSHSQPPRLVLSLTSTSQSKC